MGGRGLIDGLSRREVRRGGGGPASLSFRVGSSCVVEIGESTFNRDQEKSTYERSSPAVPGKLRGFVVRINAANRLFERLERRSDHGLRGKEKSDS